MFSNMGTTAAVLGLLSSASVISVPHTLNQTDEPITALLPGLSFIFTVIAPKIITSQSSYCAYVTVDSGESPVKFSLWVNSSSETYTANPEAVDVNTSKRICIKVPNLKKDDEKYNLNVKAEHKASEVFEQTTDIFVDRKIQTILVQTDKPVYKPGEIVKFRVLSLDRDLKPLKNSKLTIMLKDPQANIVKKWLDIEATQGLFSSEFLLSEEPTLGDWVFEVESNLGEQEHHTFSVEKYVLPKFKTEVKLPPFATYKDSKITVEVVSMYTYGKGVKGEAIVSLSEINRYQIYPYYIRGSYVVSPQSEKVIKTVPIDGSAFVEFDITKEMQIDSRQQKHTKEFEIQAVVTESVTSKKHNATGKIKLYKHPWKIELVDSPSNYKPGFPLTLTIKVAYQNDVPVQDSNPEALVIKHGFAYHEEDAVLKFPIPANGLVPITFKTPSNERLNVNSIDARYKTLNQTLYVPQKASSKSQSYIQVTPRKTDVTPGEILIVDFQASKPIKMITYLLHSRGELQDSKVLTNGDGETKLIENVKIPIPNKTGSKVTLLVYGIFTSDNEVVIDSTELKVNRPALNNYLNVSTSAKQVEPGNKLSICVEAKEHSMVALRGVDQSVLILKEDKDINMAVVKEELKAYEDSATAHKGWGGSSAFQVTENAGLVLLTNGKFVKQRKYVIYDDFDFMPMPMMAMAREGAVMEMAAEDNAAPVMMRMKSSSASIGGASAEPPRVRTKFPETWIWDEIVLNDSSKTEFDKIVPDTLTSWIISGFSLNSEFGLGVVEESLKVEVFRPFFITLNKPYSVVKGEILALQVLVHNYMSEDVTAKIVFEDKENQFSFADGDATAVSQSKSVHVKSKEVSSVTFLIIPDSFGTLKLHVVGTTDTSGDAISQPLIVKPPGQKQVGNEAILISLDGKEKFNTVMKASFPESRVLGADYLKLSVVGDLMGSTMKNLDKLLQMPSGCGEQNMLTFVPDLVILDYLEVSATTQVDPTIRKKAIQYLECGYQRQLNYRRHDSSFSAFGNSDPQGSTWLTAFVVRSFISAKRYITIDDGVVDSALGFLAHQQQRNGEFREYGRVIHSELKGGVDASSKGYAMTAYVLLAFLEASNSKFNSHTVNNIDPIVRRAIRFLTSIPSSLSDSYALNLITYALEVANHPKKNKFFDRLESLAKVEGTYKWWENPKTKEDKLYEQDCRRFHPWKKPTKSASVEMTAYGALTHLHRGNVANSFPIVKWLLSQQNENGGFISTQDTVVGLTALGKFAEKTKAKNTDLLILAKYHEKSVNWTLNNDNLDVYHQNEIAEVPKEISVEASGEGSALFQLTWHFYVEDVDKAPAFKLDVHPFSGKLPSELQLKVCTSFLRSETDSNMAIVEINLPSGFELESDSLDELKMEQPTVMRYDTEDSNTKVSLYLSSISHKSICLSVEATRLFKVAKPARPYVQVYDYYDTTKKVRSFYDPPEYHVCDICKSDPQACTVNCVH